MSYLVKDPFFGDEIRCEPGEQKFPHDCERHGNHYWCGVCAGYYGVPHGDIHTGPNKHPNSFTYRYDGCACVCRVCVNARAEVSR